MNKSLCTLFAVLLAPSAFAQGEGEGEEPCNGVTAEGECQGTDAVFCGANDVLSRVACGAFETADTTLVGSCDVFPGFGSWCAFDDGDACAFNNADGDVVSFACSSPNSGCIDGVCIANIGTCTPPPPGTAPDLVCEGNILASCQPWSQLRQELDCNGETTGGALLGGTCSSGACIGVGVGLFCVAGVVECEPGLTCEGATAESAGTCTDVSNPVECIADNDCPGVAICDDGSCVNVECEQDSNCDGTDICNNNLCVPDGNGGGEGEEPGGEGEAPDPFPVDDCEDDGDCNDNADCVGGECVPRGSQDACERDNDCSTDGEICEDDVCIEEECSRDGDCDNDEECDSGRCERVREEPEPDPAPVDPCGGGFAVAPLAVLIAARRRRQN